SRFERTGYRSGFSRRAKVLKPTIPSRRKLDVATSTPAPSITNRPGLPDFPISHDALDMFRPLREPANTSLFFPSFRRYILFIHSPDVSEIDRHTLFVKLQSKTAGICPPSY